VEGTARPRVYQALFVAYGDISLTVLLRAIANCGVVISMGKRTTELLEILRAWCKEKRGRQTQVARILGVRPSTVADWMSGRRSFTGEQSLSVNEFLRTVYAYQKPVEEPSNPGDPLSALHSGLENPDTKTVWVRSVGSYHHVILGGPARDKALARLLELMRNDRK